MFKHKFIFSTGSWIGEGKIHLSNIEDELVFYTRWRSMPIDHELNELETTQEIQIAGHSDIMLNHYVFSNFNGKHFDVDLENQAWGRVFGHGMVKEDFIGWEFRNNDLQFEGYEYYQLLDEDGCYEVKAEYVTPQDEFRTLITGKIWQQVPKE